MKRIRTGKAKREYQRKDGEAEIKDGNNISNLRME